MKKDKKFELPKHLIPLFKKAKKIEWITLLYLISVIVVVYYVMGSSQAMKTAWLEDALSVVPSLSFLVASKFYNKELTPEFPYGYHKVYSIAFLCGSVALFGMGAFLIIDSSFSLFNMEYPTIGSKVIFGHQVWLGWLMIGALVYSGVPPVILGRLKMPLAIKLHNKILFADASAQKADYMTAFAAIAGILGVGIGWWWADATAAIFISFSVLKDGYQNLKNSITDLLNRHPKHVKTRENDELVEQIEDLVRSWYWVNDAQARFREDGQIYFGEIIITVNTEENLTQLIENGLGILSDFHWKIFDVTIMPVKELPS